MKHVNWLVRHIFYRHQSIPLEFLNNHEESLYYDVTYMAQQHANLCLDTSEAMIDCFWGKPFHSMTKNPRSVAKEKPKVSKHFIEMSPSIEALKQILCTYGPLILSLPMKYDFSHSVVCVGYTNDYLIYHDPLESGNRCIHVNELLRINENKGVSIAFVTTALDDKDTLKNKKININQYSGFKKLKNTAYASFFSLLNQPLDASQRVIELLEDYAYGNKYLHPNRHHREEVIRCLKAIHNDDAMTPQELMALIEKELGPSAALSKGSLYQRIETMKTFIPQ